MTCKRTRSIINGYSLLFRSVFSWSHCFTYGVNGCLRRCRRTHSLLQTGLSRNTISESSYYFRHYLVWSSHSFMCGSQTCSGTNCPTLWQRHRRRNPRLGSGRSNLFSGATYGMYFRYG